MPYDSRLPEWERREKRIGGSHIISGINGGDWVDFVTGTISAIFLLTQMADFDTLASSFPYL